MSSESEKKEIVESSGTKPQELSDANAMARFGLNRANPISSIDMTEAEVLEYMKKASQLSAAVIVSGRIVKALLDPTWKDVSLDIKIEKVLREMSLLEEYAAALPSLSSLQQSASMKPGSGK